MVGRLLNDVGADFDFEGVRRATDPCEMSEMMVFFHYRRGLALMSNGVRRQIHPAIP